MITLGHSIQIKGTCYKNGVEITVEQAIDEIRTMARLSLLQELISEIENKTPPKDRIWSEEFEDGWERGKQDILTLLTNKMKE